jgi:hypothetical protein
MNLAQLAEVLRVQDELDPERERTENMIFEACEVFKAIVDRQDSSEK